MGCLAVIALAEHGEQIGDHQQRGGGGEQKPADDGAGERRILLLAGTADRLGSMPTIIAAAVISTGRMRVRPARIAASNAFMPACCCSRAKVTSRMEFADATPTAMMAPIRDGTLSVVPVT